MNKRKRHATTNITLYAVHKSFPHTHARAHTHTHSLSLPHSQAQIKATLPGLMLSTPPLVQAQLSEALSIICSHDFPNHWPTLLPELVGRLQEGRADLATLNGVLATANSIFKRCVRVYACLGVGEGGCSPGACPVLVL